MSVLVEAAGQTIFVEGRDDDQPMERATLRLSADDAEELCVALMRMGFGPVEPAIGNHPMRIRRDVSSGKSGGGTGRPHEMEGCP